MTAFALLLAVSLPLPPVGDCHRFPPIPYLQAGLAFNRAYQCHLRDRLSWEPEYRHGPIRTALAEAERAYATWDAAWGAQDKHYDRRMYQRKLIGLIGWDAYWRAELPPPVPMWRFNDLRW